MTVALAVLLVLGQVTPKESCESLRKTARFATPYFERVELEKLVQTVADATCRAFIIGEGVRGKISIIGPENGHATLDSEQFYAAFLAALDINGLAVTPAGRFLRIVDKPRAKGFPIPFVADEGDKFPARDEMVTRVFQVQNTELEPVRALVTQFVSPGADVIAFPPQTLIVNELGSNLERVARIIESVDVERRPNESLRVVTVRYAEATALADEVSRVLAPKAPKAGEVLALTPDERSNRIVMLATPGLEKRAIDLIAQLDVALPGDGKAHVYRLANAEAKELAANLAEVAAAARPKGSPAAAVADPKITANESLNALVIVAGNADYRNLVELIRELDVPRKQVFIETVVMEVNLERNEQLGASGHFVAAPDGVPIVVGSQPAGAPSSVDLSGLASASGLLFGVQGPEVKALSTALGFSVGQFGLAFTARQSTGDMNVISTPHILTTDNKEAEISVGQRIPFQQGLNPALVSQLVSTTGTNAAAAAAATGSIVRERVELKLIVKPHIGEGDNIRLEVNQSAEEITGEPGLLGPTTATRAQKTTIIATDSETVVLGGIMQDRVIEDVQKTPVLGDIPILGRLFRYEKKRKIKVNLLVFLTPHVIREPGDLQKLMVRKLEERRKVMQQAYGTDDTAYPIDYSRRPGPLMAMMRALKHAQLAPENGGPGAPEEKVIEPK